MWGEDFDFMSKTDLISSREDHLGQPTGVFFAGQFSWPSFSHHDGKSFHAYLGLPWINRCNCIQNHMWQICQRWKGSFCRHASPFHSGIGIPCWCKYGNAPEGHRCRAVCRLSLRLSDGKSIFLMKPKQFQNTKWGTWHLPTHPPNTKLFRIFWLHLILRWSLNILHNFALNNLLLTFYTMTWY